jgi:hypothetical protein
MNTLDAFQAASGFQVSWVHFFMLVLSGATVIIIAAALVTCLVHKLNGGVFQQGASLIAYMLFLAMIVAVFIGVLKTM